MRNLTYIREDRFNGIGPWTCWDAFSTEKTLDIIAPEYLQWFEPIINDHVRDWSIAVQAGGHQGFYPRMLAEKFGLVYTFEPDPMNFYCLTQNCDKLNILKMQAALGPSAGEAHLEVTHTSGQHRINDGEQKVYPLDVVGAFRVPMLSIDSLNLRDCGLLFIDTENYELPVLLGAMQTIRKFKPLIIVEKGFDPDNFASIVSLLKGLGYHMEIDMTCDAVFKCW
jgi:FkbM family methyltransferase